MRFDIVVVGSGLCGSLAAQHLEREGHSVLMLEAGPALPAELPADVAGFQRAVAPVTAVAGERWAFAAPRGYEWHRVRARGGRTLLWGGWMERPPPDYFEARQRDGAAWPASFSGLAPWVRRAERVLSVRSGRVGRLHRTLAGLGVTAGPKREAVLLGKRRMLTAADLKLETPVQCDSPVLRVERVGDVLAVHTTTGAAVAARRIVLAASPIESARILEASLPLSLRRRRVDLHDHLISGAIAICGRERASVHPRAAAEPSAVVHPSPRSRLRYTLEVRGPTPLEALDTEDLQALGFTPDEAAKRSFYVVFAMGETDPHAPRHVEFDSGTLDALGRPVPRFIRRRHTAREKQLGAQMNERVLGLAKRLANGPKQAFLIYDALDFSSGGHEVGTCVGRLDARMEALALPNVFVADGAGVPAATDRHPSLTLAANALRVAEAVATSLRA